MTKRYARNPPATQIEAWKRAIADQRKQQRRDRWKRPGPQIVGVRIMPASRNATSQQEGHQ